MADSQSKRKPKRKNVVSRGFRTFMSKLTTGQNAKDGLTQEEIDSLNAKDGLFAEGGLFGKKRNPDGKRQKK